ncbi:MAG: hypothetical protein ACTSUE_11295 [Promethearchaeota archaeon]
MVVIFFILVVWRVGCGTPLVKDVEIIAFLDEGGKDTYAYTTHSALTKTIVTATVDYLSRGPGMIIFLNGFSNETTTEVASGFIEAQVWFAGVPGVVDFEFSVTVTCPPSGCGDQGLRYRIVLTEEATATAASGGTASGGSDDDDDGSVPWELISIFGGSIFGIVFLVCLFCCCYCCYHYCWGPYRG